ncbi:MAG: YozE family protein [Desulfamplus sp.]
MNKLSIREIIKEIPNIQTVILPSNWFDDLNSKHSVFYSLYDWMLKNKQVPSDDKESLHNRTYVGERLFSKLITTEKNRLTKKLKIKGKELDRAVGWSDINLGPKTEIGGCSIRGDAIFVMPESSRQALGAFSLKVYKRERDTTIKKIQANAAGATFYQWLLPQVERPDRVGDIARDAVGDENFPRESNQYEEIKSYLEPYDGNHRVIDSLKESWVEYLEKYPERVQPYAWCCACGEKINVENALLSLNLDTQELEIYDEKCFNDFRQYEDLLSRPLSAITHDELKKLAVKYELSEYQTAVLFESLKLWGILPINSCTSTTTHGTVNVRRSISNSKRYDVLKRDRFQCVLCGASGNEARLEIDHIIPVSRGGTDAISNLQCLCFKCNRGKHAKTDSKNNILE